MNKKLKKFIALLTKEKWLRMNGKMTLTFKNLDNTFSILLLNLFKERCISFVKRYEYLNQLTR